MPFSLLHSNSKIGLVDSSFGSESGSKEPTFIIPFFDEIVFTGMMKLGGMSTPSLDLEFLEMTSWEEVESGYFLATRIDKIEEGEGVEIEG